MSALPPESEHYSIPISAKCKHRSRLAAALSYVAAGLGNARFRETQLSALPPKAGIDQRTPDVRLVPLADIARRLGRSSRRHQLKVACASKFLAEGSKRLCTCRAIASR